VDTGQVPPKGPTGIHFSGNAVYRAYRA